MYDLLMFLMIFGRVSGVYICACVCVCAQARAFSWEFLPFRHSPPVFLRQRLSLAWNSLSGLGRLGQ